jgi:hypothetical protein
MCSLGNTADFAKKGDPTRIRPHLQASSRTLQETSARGGQAAFEAGANAHLSEGDDPLLHPSPESSSLGTIQTAGDDEQSAQLPRHEPWMTRKTQERAQTHGQSRVSLDAPRTLAVT